jgi:phosphoglycolate phosphatase
MDLLIFDLDGTLIDSKQDIVNSVNVARGRMGLLPLDAATVASYVGNGAPVLMRKAMGQGATEESIAESLRHFLEYYHENPLVYTTLYPGVREALDELLASGKRLAVLTNKPESISHQIVEGLGLSDHFFRVYGGDSFAERKPHPIAIQKLMEESGIEASGTVMVGDSSVDVQTARNAGVTACGVTYGFSPESLAQEPPDFLINDMRELSAYAGKA